MCRGVRPSGRHVSLHRRPWRLHRRWQPLKNGRITAMLVVLVVPRRSQLLLSREVGGSVPSSPSIRWGKKGCRVWGSTWPTSYLPPECSHHESLALGRTDSYSYAHDRPRQHLGLSV
ncbi:hypothetical protein K461DRAFT_65416 [Myriangium duriaei CBS 260.36]|uniref:Uncharacterized protein n=1 Tax=Myriangium duriaei CBS 260.36 TaxID=1168546 RepID=A0A9P4IX86_9PEZI|nr:hypothetical protein K461DRAFT_65416 [Myriangium duriaei CBS 260.36]